MASPAELRNYLACWFQLGKGVQIQTTGETLRPASVLHNGTYSDAFEACWATCQAQGLSRCFLEGTRESLETILNPAWEVDDCARCSMPVLKKVGSASDMDCPCHDLSNWPNLEIPAPHGVQPWRARLDDIRDRLKMSGERFDPADAESCNGSGASA